MVAVSLENEFIALNITVGAVRQNEDAFMLANDDPRVLRGRARLTAESSSVDGESSRAGRVDWTKCETLHQQARSLENLGGKRPLTNWSDSTNTAMPSFAWNEWTNAQVHRIHDLMDINTLRLAKCGIDGTYKTMVWNLSQVSATQN